MQSVICSGSSQKVILLAAHSWMDEIVYMTWLHSRTPYCPVSRAGAFMHSIFGAFGVFAVLFLMASGFADCFMNATAFLIFHFTE